MPATVRSLGRILGSIAAGGLFAAITASSAASASLEYLADRDAAADVVIDARAASDCAAASLAGARCLPAADFLGPHRRLANSSGILWLLGTAGLTGDEHVLVIGDTSEGKEFLAGLLYLAGQRRVSLQTLPLSVPAEGAESRPPGRARAMIRQTVFQAPMRDQRILLRSELVRLLDTEQPPILLDGRGEAEYWGEKVRAQRGGHLPGAQHLPAQSLTAADPESVAAPLDPGGAGLIAYAHDAFEGVVYLARLIGSGVDARLYLEGWAGWASDGALPADSLTFPSRRAVAPVRVMRPDPIASSGWPKFLLAGLAGTALAMGGFWSGRLMRRQT